MISLVEYGPDSRLLPGYSCSAEPFVPAAVSCFPPSAGEKAISTGRSGMVGSLGQG